MQVFTLVKGPAGLCLLSIPVVVLLAVAAVAPASSSYRSRVPNGSVFSCRTCHNGSEGNSGNVGDFGNDFADNGFKWSASLANKDSDGDGAKNGVELLDPNGTWVKGQANPGSSSNVRNPNSSSSVPPKATPTPSPSPSPSSTPTPSPSPSPTAVPTPVATSISFPFLASAEGWTFASPADFAVSTGGHDVASQSLRISTTNNTNAFALQQSPAFLIAPTSPGGIVVIDGKIGADSLYRATYHSRSNLANGAIVPAIRLRSNSANFEQGDVMVISSSGNGDLSPGTTTKTYRQYFSQPASSNGFSLSFDVLNFDPGDSAASSLFVEDVTAEALTVPDPSAGTAFSSIDFASDGASGFTFHNVLPTMGEPSIHTDAAGLNIAGTAPVTARFQVPAGTLFGYWEGQSASAITTGSLYAVSFTIASNATADNKAKTPTFRLRINDSSLKLSAYVNIDARGTDSRIPVAGAPEVYTVWFEAPAAIGGSTLLYSFDYLYMGGSDEDPAIQLTLQALNAKAYPAP